MVAGSFAALSDDGKTNNSKNKYGKNKQELKHDGGN
jgi:hypothetical protein